MSLESKIEALTAAVEKLTEVIVINAKSGPSQLSFNFDGEQVANEVEQVKEEVKTAPEKTHDDLKEVCLKVARAGKKAEVKEIIASYGVTKSIDVPVDMISDCIAKVEAL